MSKTGLLTPLLPPRPVNMQQAVVSLDQLWLRPCHPVQHCPAMLLFRFSKMHLKSLLKNSEQRAACTEKYLPNFCALCSSSQISQSAHTRASATPSCLQIWHVASTEHPVHSRVDPPWGLRVTLSFFCVSSNTFSLRRSSLNFALR